MSPFVWRPGLLEIVVDDDPAGPASLVSIAPAGVGDAARREPTSDDFPVLRQPLATQPLVEIATADRGHARSGQRLVETAVGRELTVLGVDEERHGDTRVLTIRQRHQGLGLLVESRLEARPDVAAVTIRTRVENRGRHPVTLTAVSSLAYAVPSGQISADDAELSAAHSDWLAENRWHVEHVRDRLLPDLGLRLHGQDPRGAVTASSTGSWSTGTRLPMGVLHDLRTGSSLAWQIESGGSGWTWEVGERRQGLYLVAQGPDDRRQQWRRSVQPGDAFETVSATIAVSSAVGDGAVAELTRHRRSARRQHPDGAALPVVFNDYMNTLDGDPTTDRLLPLVAAAARAGAETFVIDAGWYDDGTDWWDAVGEWRPSARRFADGGLGRVIDAIREAGMTPGLWLEPEIVGERSPVAQSLPPEAFFQRQGRRVLEHGRYHLDLRHPAAVAHLDAALDRLIADFGIGYVKFDYNIDAIGTEVDSDSPGDGLLSVDRARLDWIVHVLERHPDLTVENCSSGAMRADPATLETYQLQSTSDQQNWLLYPPIAASTPMSLLPEQAASWAYPQPEMTAEESAFTLVTGLAGRLYLSGFLDRMTIDQLALVQEATAAFRSIRHRLARSVPLWPTGLPGWTDAQLTLGFRDETGILLFAWNRDPDAPAFDVPLPSLAGRTPRVTPVFPARLPRWGAAWRSADGTLALTPTRGHATARVFAIDDDAAQH